MNMGEDWAAPHSADPISNMMKKTRKDHCMIILVRAWFNCRDEKRP
jgi:hypothetical protein